MNPTAVEPPSAPVPRRRLLELFPGPVPFTEEDDQLFFGRDGESERLRDLLTVYRTVVLHAQSGSGKTSLVRAGLVPLLRRAGIGWTRCRVGGVFASTLKRTPDVNVFTCVLLSAFGPESCRATSIADGLLALDKAYGQGARHVLILDQFEELFTNFPDRWRDRELFFSQLAEALKVRPELRILFVIREEFVSRLEPFSFHLPEQFQIRMFLQRLRGASALDAVREPFKLADVSFESEQILEQFVNNLRKERVQKDFSADGVEEYTGEFPDLVQLQVVCRNLARGVDQARVGTIGQKQIELYGNPERSLIRFYEEAIERVAAAEKIRPQKLRLWFEEQMITSGGTRGTVFMEEKETAGLENRVVKALEESAHLVRSEPRAGGIWYEITHDRLIVPVRQSNREWRAKQNKGLMRAVVASLIAAVVVLTVILWRIETHRVAAEAESRQKEVVSAQSHQQVVTTKDLFARAAQSQSESLIAKQVAQALADFETGESSLNDLSSRLGQAWARDHLITCQTMDALLPLFPMRPPAKPDWPAPTEAVRALRRDFLRNLKTFPAQGSPFRNYLCSHNAAVVIASFAPKSQDAKAVADEVNRWRVKGLNAAIAGRPTGHGDIQIVADYFLSEDEASDLIGRLDAAFPTNKAYAISCYKGCKARFGGPVGYTLFDAPQ